MAPRRDRRPESLALDPDVLREGPVCEFQSDVAVAQRGGTTVQPWRDRFRAAEAEGLHVVDDARALREASYPQVLVHLQKSRAATAEDLVQAWRVCEPRGQLLLAGPNRLGITSAVKKLASQLEQEGIVVANRARSRIVRFRRGDGPGPRAEATPDIQVTLRDAEGGSLDFVLETAPGVFSAKKLDAGSALLLEALPELARGRAPRQIVDLGCGTGVLGIAAARLWPQARVLLVEADARAVRCARANIARLGLDERCRVEWWDAREAPLESRLDLALSNPPFHHRGPEVDLGPALALFDSLRVWLRPSGRALVVANRTLPYEEPLSRLGPVETLAAARGYKLLSLKRSARSSGSRGRSSPGPRSSGSSRSPIRSR